MGRVLQEFSPGAGLVVALCRPALLGTWDEVPVPPWLHLTKHGCCPHKVGEPGAQSKC